MESKMPPGFTEGPPRAFRPIFNGDPWEPNHWTFREVPMSEAGTKEYRGIPIDTQTETCNDEPIEPC